jgi:hypothetical protein
MFTITNSKDFYEKLVDEFNDFHKNLTSARIALNFAITAYHMAEWVWGDWLKGDMKAKAVMSVNTVNEFKDWLDIQCPIFTAMQGITNGTKHFDRRAFGKTQKTEGIFFRDAFQSDAFSVERF